MIINHCTIKKKNVININNKEFDKPQQSQKVLSNIVL